MFKKKKNTFGGKKQEEEKQNPLSSVVKSRKVESVESVPMDAENLSMSADLLSAATGYCLTPEERALLPSSLAILKNEHGFSK